jgi:choline dehydrogenase
MTRRGPFASNGCEAGGFVRTRPDTQLPDLQFHFLAVAPSEVALDEVNYEPKGRGCSILPTLIYPQSVGELRLASDDPTAPPVIDPRYLQAPEDLSTLVRGVRMAHEISQTAPVADVLGEPLLPASDPRASDAEVEADVRARGATIFHPVGTCKMGADAEAVVDAELRVHGLEGLRVADASIMPRIIGGNTNAPVIMIGEKASDLMLGLRPGAPTYATAETELQGHGQPVIHA